MASLAYLLSGCGAKGEDEDALPWSRPASWEGNKLPGLAPNYGQRTY